MPMNKIEEMIKELCPNGVEWKKFGEICTIVRGIRVVKSQLKSEGKYPVFQNSLAPMGYFDEYNRNSGTYLISAGAAGDIGFCKTEFWSADDCLTFLDSKVFIEKYLYYFLKTKQPYLYSNVRKASIPRLSKDVVANLSIPLPPLPIQTEIVRILDKFVEQQEQLERLIELRKKQYEYYREEMLKPKEGEDTIPLSDIAEIGTGSSNTNEELENGKYPFFVRSQEVRSKDEYEFDEEAVITSGDGVGVGKIFHYVNGKYALHQRAYRIHITDSNYNPKFFFYYMKNTFLDYISRTEVKSSVQSIRRPMLNKYPVPCYSIEKQKEIIDIFDSFESSIASLKSALELSKKRYEYYRDKMMRF